jgi:hypothetical protein
MSAANRIPLQNLHATRRQRKAVMRMAFLLSRLYVAGGTVTRQVAEFSSDSSDDAPTPRHQSTRELLHVRSCAPCGRGNFTIYAYVGKRLR